MVLASLRAALFSRQRFGRLNSSASATGIGIHVTGMLQGSRDIGWYGGPKDVPTLFVVASDCRVDDGPAGHISLQQLSRKCQFSDHGPVFSSNQHRESNDKDQWR